MYIVSKEFSPQLEKYQLIMVAESQMNYYFVLTKNSDAFESEFNGKFSESDAPPDNAKLRYYSRPLDLEHLIPYTKERLQREYYSKLHEGFEYQGDYISISDSDLTLYSNLLANEANPEIITRGNDVITLTQTLLNQIQAYKSQLYRSLTQNLKETNTETSITALISKTL